MEVIQRTIGRKVRDLAVKFPVISITGPRQSGKTTLAKQLFPDYQYVNFEDPNLRLMAKEAPRELLNHRGKGIILDEAQYVPEIFSFIQLLADEHQLAGEFVLTGSQHFLFIEKITQSLAGRVAIFNLLPFSIRELSNTKHKLNSPLQYILNGFYPRIYDRGIDPVDFYPSYIQTYVERDVRQLVNVTNLDSFQRFMRLCAGRTGQLFNQTEVGGIAGVDQKTVANWLSILKTGFQVFTLPPYFQNFNKRIVKTPKIYFYDTGLACSLLGIRSIEALQNHFARGALFENFIIVEFLKSRFNRGLPPDLYFWRDYSGNEVDLLIEENTKLYPIEIKAGEIIQADYFKGLQRFSSLSAPSMEKPILIYGGDQSFDTANGRVFGWNHLPEI